MKVMESMKANNNGSYSDYQRLLDLVRDYDEQLADTMLEMIDDDPARLQYKKRNLKSIYPDSLRCQDHLSLLQVCWNV